MIRAQWAGKKCQQEIASTALVCPKCGQPGPMVSNRAQAIFITIEFRVRRCASVLN
jgi:hypothetical protein